MASPTVYYHGSSNIRTKLLAIRNRIASSTGFSKHIHTRQTTKTEMKKKKKNRTKSSTFYVFIHFLLYFDVLCAIRCVPLVLFIATQHRHAVVQWSKVNFHRALIIAGSTFLRLLPEHWSQCKHEQNVKNVEKRKLNFGVVTSASVSSFERSRALCRFHVQRPIWFDITLHSKCVIWWAAV